MSTWSDFKVMSSAEMPDGDKYTVYYKYGKTFCKRLDYDFLDSVHAERVAAYLQLWSELGGTVRCSGDKDAPGFIVNLDGSNISGCHVPLTTQLFHLFYNGGYCPLQMAAFLLHLPQRNLEYLLHKHDISVLMAGRVKLVDLKEIRDGFLYQRSKKDFKKALDKLSESLAVYEDEYKRLKLLLPTLRLIFRLMTKEAPNDRDGRIFLEFLQGCGLSVLGGRYDMTSERVRQIFTEQLKSLNQIIMHQLLDSSKQAELVARNAALEQEVARLRIEAKLIKVEEALNLQPDKEMRSWAQAICRLLHMPLSEMNFTTRTYNVLQSLGVDNIFQLSRLDGHTLETTRNSGKKTVCEVMEFCNKFHLRRLSNPVCLKYIERMNRDLSASELEVIGKLGYSLDDDGSLWLPEYVESSAAVEKFKKLSSPEFNEETTDWLPESAGEVWDLKFLEEMPDGTEPVAGTI